MEGLGFIETMLKWVTTSARLRVLFLATAAFGAFTYYCDSRGWLEGIDRFWIMCVYAAGVGAGLVVVFALLDVIVRWLGGRIRELINGWRQHNRALEAMPILQTHHRICMRHMALHNMKRFTDQEYRTLPDLVELGVLRHKGGPENTAIFEVPGYVWKWMRKQGWHEGQRGMNVRPWDPHNGRFL